MLPVPFCLYIGCGLQVIIKVGIVLLLFRLSINNKNNDA